MKYKRATTAAAALALGSGLAIAAVQSSTASAAPPAPNCESFSSGPANAPLSTAGLKTNGDLVCFRVNAPSGAVTIGTITGLSVDTSLVGIDYRVQDGLLYGVGNQGGIYTISTDDASATKVGQLSVALTGTLFGVDFNPAANALRIVGNDGQNLRVPFTGTDPGTPSAVTTVDTNLNNGATPPVTVTGVVGAAYTNNDADVNTATTLFDLNAGINQLAIQSPANNGTVVPTGTFIPDAVDGDLDIYTRAGNGVNVSYAVVVLDGGASRISSVKLLNGQISAGRPTPGVFDLALPIAQNQPPA